MVSLVIVGILGLYLAALAWALRVPHPRRLWTVAIGMTALLTIAATCVGIWYAVPSVPRLVQYVIALFGPAIVLPALLLSSRRASFASLNTRRSIALAGAFAGLVCGWLFVVYVLRVW